MRYQGPQGYQVYQEKKYEAIKEVDDEGQYRIPAIWVISEQKDNGKGQKKRAHLFMRGNREKDKGTIRRISLIRDIEDIRNTKYLEIKRIQK